MSAVIEVIIGGVVLAMLVWSRWKDQRDRERIEAERLQLLEEMEAEELEEQEAAEEELVLILSAAEEQLEALQQQRDAIIREANRTDVGVGYEHYKYDDMKRSAMLSKAARISAQMCEIRLRTKKRISKY